MAIIFKKKNAFWLLTLLIIPLVISVVLINRQTSHIERSNIIIFDRQVDIINEPEEPILDLQEYWSNDLARTESTPLNWYIYERDDDIEVDDKIIYSFDIKYNSPNWLGQSEEIIEIDADLFIPKSVYRTIEKVPAMLLLHGLYAHGNILKDIAINLAKEGFVVLTPDLPGHRESEGAEPTIENLFPMNNFSYQSHPLLSIMASLQGLRVLESIDRVDTAKIGIYGESYGGLIAMYLCGLIPEKISLTVTSLSLGNFESFDGKSYLFSLMGIKKSDLGENFWKSETAQIIDPIYYLKKSNIPPIAWIVGTNDEIFDIAGLNETYYSVQGPKWLQIHQNGHHALSKHEDTIVYLANYVLANQTAPPNIEKIINAINVADFGNEFTIKADINSEIKIKSVELSFKYRNIVGQPWKTIQMNHLENNTWVGTIKHSILSTKLEFFIIINLNDNSDKMIWFTSNIFNAGILTSSFNSAFWLMISTIIFILFITITHAKFREFENNLIENKNYALRIFSLKNTEGLIYNELNEQANLTGKINGSKKKLLIYMIIRTILLLLLQVVIVATYFIPWTTFYKMGYSPIYIFNNFFTYTEFISFGFIFTYIFIILTVTFGLLSFIRPKLIGKINLTWGFIACIIIAFYSIMVIRTGFAASISIGPFIIMLCGVSQLYLHKWFTKREKTILNQQISKIITYM